MATRPPLLDSAFGLRGRPRLLNQLFFRALLPITLVLTLHGAADRYFRHDGGVAGSEVDPLPEALEPARNLRWRAPLDSGHSSPILYGAKVFLTTYRPADEELAVVALDRATGRQLWKRGVPTDRIEAVHLQMGNPASSTPACDGQRLYVFFGSYGLLCYDLEGQRLWERRLGPFQDEFGAGSSPILFGDTVILNQDHDRDSYLIAVAREDGRTVWKRARPNAVRSYASPVIWPRDRAPELLVAGALELTSYDPISGEPLWWVNGLARIVIPLPVVESGVIYMASWSPGGDAGARLTLDPWTRALAKWDANQDGQLARAEIDSPGVLDRFYRMDTDQNGQLIEPEWERHAEVFRLAQNAVLALRPQGRGNLTERALLWKYHRGVPYVATPLVRNGILWMVKDGGIVTALETDSGKVIHEERLPGLGTYSASPVSGDDKLYFASTAGRVSVVAAKREWLVLSSHDFHERIFATPALDRRRVYIRTENALYAFEDAPGRR